MCKQPLFLCAGLWRVGIILAGVFTTIAAYGSESCGAWLMTETDPGGGKYLMTLQLRSCDLTGGVSAFLQFKNSGSENLKLSYRVFGEAEKILKEGTLTVGPGETKRDATCQQCAKRKGGIKTWEMVSVEILSSEASSTPAQPVEDVIKTQDMEPTEKTIEVTMPNTTETDTSASEGSKVIPWDQLPPEFR